LTTTSVLAVTLALLSAAAFAVATVAQQRAAARSSDVDARAAAFVGQLLRRPQWWAGTLGNGLGYALQAGALAFGSLLLVQPLVVVSLLFALPLGARAAHRPLPRGTFLWGGLLVVALGVFVGLSDPSNGAHAMTPHGWLLLCLIAVTLMLVGVVAARSRSGAARTRLLAVIVGLLAGLLAVLTKTVIAIAGAGVVHLLASGQLYALIVVGAAGIYLQQLAFQSGPLHTSLPILSVLEPLSAALLGVVLLHEHVQVSGASAVVLAVVVVVLVVATVCLARDEAVVAEALEEPRLSASATPAAQMTMPGTARTPGA
jgi:drug/metabolite transporter (DMT)-like permease